VDQQKILINIYEKKKRKKKIRKTKEWDESGTPVLDLRIL
jgi:hypothetical protein